MEIINLSRKYHFSAGEDSPHSQWGTGADWEVEVTLSGYLNSKTGLVINLIDLDALVKPCVESLNKKHLNKEVKYFAIHKVNPTNVAKYLYTNINEQIKKQWGN